LGAGVGSDQQGPGNHQRRCGERQRQKAPAQFAAAWATGDTFGVMVWGWKNHPHTIIYENL